jgi:hypothetical protein
LKISEDLHIIINPTCEVYMNPTSEVYMNVLEKSSFDVSLQSRKEVLTFFRLFYHIGLCCTSLDSISCEKKFLSEKIKSYKITIYLKKNGIMESNGIVTLSKELEQFENKFIILDEREERYAVCMHKYVEKFIDSYHSFEGAMSEEIEMLKNELGDISEKLNNLCNCKRKNIESVILFEQQKNLVENRIEKLKDWQLFYADFVSRYSKMMSEIES